MPSSCPIASMKLAISAVPSKPIISANFSWAPSPWMFQPFNGNLMRLTSPPPLQAAGAVRSRVHRRAGEVAIGRAGLRGTTGRRDLGRASG